MICLLELGSIIGIFISEMTVIDNNVLNNVNVTMTFCPCYVIISYNVTHNVGYII